MAVTELARGWEERELLKAVRGVVEDLCFTDSASI